MTAVIRPFKISVLLFIRDTSGRQLLLERTREPNKGMWSPIGGKLEMGIGESPCECAIREAGEEAGMQLTEADLHLFAMISEKSYEGGGHWLMFLYNCRKTLDSLPPPIGEGSFAFFSREEMATLPLPETDRQALWPVYDQYRDGFVAMRADCDPSRPLEVVVEESWREGEI